MMRPLLEADRDGHKLHRKQLPLELLALNLSKNWRRMHSYFGVDKESSSMAPGRVPARMTENPYSKPPPNGARKASAFIARHPYVILALFFTLVLIAASSLTRLKFSTSSEMYVNEHEPALQAFREYQKLFDVDDPIVVGSIGNTSVFDRERFQRLTKLHEELEALQGVDQVLSIRSASWASNDGNMMDFEPLVKSVPTTEAEADALRKRAMSDPLLAKLWLSRDEKTALFVVQPETTEGDPLARPEDLVRALDELRAQHKGPDRLSISGHPYTMTVITQASKRDVFLYAPLTVVALSLLLILLYRNVWAAIIPLVATGSVSALVMATKAFRDQGLSEIEGILPTLFAAIGVAYSMHLINRYAHLKGSPTDRVQQALAKVALPVLISGATTAAGFSALIISGSTSTQGFGKLGAMGVVLTTFTVLVVVPAMLVVFAPSLSRHRSRTCSSQVLQAFRHAASKRRRLVIGGFVAITLIAFWGATRIEIDNSFISWLPREHAARQDVNALQDAGIGTTVVYLTVDSGHQDGALNVDLLDRVQFLAERLEKEPFVENAISLPPYLRSLHRTATQNLETKPPRSKPLYSQYMFLLEGSSFASQVEQLIDFDRRYLSVALWTNLQSSTQWTPAKKRIQTLVHETLPEGKISITGAFPLIFEATDKIALGQIRSVAIALLIIALMLVFVLRSLRWGLLTIPSNIIPIVVIFGTIGWAGIQFDSINSIIACTVLGIVIDDSVHFIVAYRDLRRLYHSHNEALRETFAIAGRPILFTTIALSLAFAIFLTSSFQSIFQVGLLGIIALVTALFSDLLLLPALLQIWGSTTPHVSMSPSGAPPVKSTVEGV